MTFEDQLFQAILGAPTTDEPRLRFADWLDESLNPLAEFIRVQCRLARGQESRGCQFELENRERELLGEFESLWSGEVAPFVDYWVFHRGFIEEIALSAGAFVAHWQYLFRRAPIQIVHINGLGDALPALVDCWGLKRLRFLDFSGNRLGDSGLRLLAQSPFLAGIQGLNLTHCGVGDAGIMALAASPHATCLRELYLDFNHCTDDGVEHLATSTALEGLQSLFIAFNNITRAGQYRLTERFGFRVRPGYHERRSAVGPVPVVVG